MAEPIPSAWQRSFLDEHRLSPAYLQRTGRVFDALASLCAQRARGRAGPLLVALNGSQGSGKSTGCAYLVEALTEVHGLDSLALSIDDFYYTRAEREALARDVHPLLISRGVPGTHDMLLLRHILERLGDAASMPVRVPRFDKAVDDRRAAEEWTQLASPPCVVLLEGWCLGLRARPEADLVTPLNALEADEDPDLRWRAYVNARLRADFEPLYDRFDLWIMLRAPGFEQVLRWRREQEEKLRLRVGGQGAGLMNEAGLQRFVSHFERWTRYCLEELPSRVDVLFELDARRNITSVHGLEEQGVQ